MELTKQCEFCDKQFVLNRKDKRFCTRRCKQYARDKRLGVRDVQYRTFKGTTCELCGFIPIHKCQLDVDHRDGNHKNNHRDNLQTLCANCHRLKTYLNKDWG